MSATGKSTHARRALRAGAWSLVPAAVLLGFPEAALACSRCFGAGADAPVVQGITMAMMALLGTTGVVGSGIVLFFMHVRRRARGLGPGRYLVTEEGDIVEGHDV